MREVKKIIRYVGGYTLGSAVAGTYFEVSSIAITAQGFPVDILGFTTSALAYDAVTNQNINGVVRNQCSWDNKRDNPGFTIGTSLIRWSQKFGVANFQEYFLNVSPFEVLTFTVTGYFDTVTANAISIEYYLLLKYQCPEDYLSVDAFAAIPK